MALPMDEQRILEQMERMLAADDPKLAARLAAFGQPGFGQVLRTRRARATLSVMTLALIAAVAAVIYMMSAFGPGSSGTNGHRPHSTQQATPPARLATRPAGQAGTAPSRSATGTPGRSGQRAGSTAQCATAIACGRWSPAERLQPRPSHQAARR